VGTNGDEKGFRTVWSERFRFLAHYVRHPNQIGAVAPSSRSLADAICEPYRRSEGPVSILEIGAGTGAVTRHIGTLLRVGDEFDICEMQAGLVEILERDVLSLPTFVPGVKQKRIRMFCCPVQTLPFDKKYDFIISCLPLTSFSLEDVTSIFEVIKSQLKDGGVLSYFEYIALRRTSRVFAVGRRRERVKQVSSFLSRQIHDHEFARRAVFQNLPPAYARHLRFDDGSRHVRSSNSARAAG